MTSQKQIEANRANAKKSTGPKSEAGKSRSSRNSWKHGLTAEVIVTTSEDAQDFYEFREALMQRYDPECSLECELVERIASLYWRLRRAPVFEAAILDYREDVIRLNEEREAREREERERREEARERERQAFSHYVLEKAREERGEEIVDEEVDEAYEEVDEQDSEEEEYYADDDEGAAILERSVKLGEALWYDAKYGNALGKLGRHETSLMNNLAKTQQMLLDLQSSRRQAEGAETESDEEVEGNEELPARRRRAA